MAPIELLKKHKSLIAYTFFGFCTTLVNLLCYRLFFFALRLPNVAATASAWFFAVMFAFITNKLWVFQSRSWSPSVLIPEAGKFFALRILTGLLDVATMYAAVDKLNQNALLWKFLSNVVVIILNYIASKIIVFARKEK